MVACAEDDEPPPVELQTAWDCQRWGTMPEAGGYYDQDYLLMTHMAMALNIYNALVRMRSLQGADIHKLTESDRKILRTLKDMGLIFNG